MCEMSDKTTTNSKWSSSREILSPYPDISTYLLSCTFRWVLDNIYTFAFIYLFNYVYFNGISVNGDYITVRNNVSIDMSCGLMYDCFVRPRLLQWSGRPGLGLLHLKILSPAKLRYKQSNLAFKVFAAGSDHNMCNLFYLENLTKTKAIIFVLGALHHTEHCPVVIRRF